MVAEKAAASLLAQGEISAESRAMVLGFGSSNGTGQSAVDLICPLVTVNKAGRQALSSCVGGLHSRTAAEGNSTDFPSAIQEAVTRLAQAGDPDRPRLVFLLTDGKLDVAASSQYGPPAQRQQAAEARLAKDVLPDAAAKHVQIWPLGFGSAPDLTAMRAMAAGGYRNNCPNVPGSVPQATKVNAAADVNDALQRIFAASRCARSSTGTRGTPPTDLFVTIPPIATDGTLEVVKQDPVVTATYYDPQGRKVPADGDFDGSHFETSGRNGAVESLRISDPRPGRWKIHLDAPTNHRSKLATSSAIWQGVLHSSIALVPGSPIVGERTVVTIRLQTRRGVVIDNAADLAGVKVSATASGAGIPAQRISLADNGQAPDRKAADGEFSGYLQVPAGPAGDLSVIGNVVADGVTGDLRPLHTRTETEPAKVIATATIDDPSVYQGHQAAGTLVVHNTDTVPHTLQLSLADLTDAADVHIGPVSIVVPAGAQSPVPFTLAFGRSMPLGEAAGRIVVTDQTANGRELSSTQLTVLVQPVPPWWKRWWPEILGGLLLILALVAAGVAVRRARVRRASPDGLYLSLERYGRVVGEIRIRTRAPSYGFAVTAPDGTPGLRKQNAGARYVISRNADGTPTVRPPRGAAQTVRSGERMSVGEEKDLVVRDERQTKTRQAGQPRPGARPTGGGRTSTRRAPGRPGAARPKPSPQPAQGARTSPESVSSYDDNF
jgi:hypothetical protein